MKILFLATAAALALTACNSKNASTQAETTMSDSIVEVTVPSILGQWDIENVVVSDTLSVRPADVDPAVKQYINFNADSSFVVVTNCNTIGGTYVVNGDSIKLGDGPATEMACENMQVEDLIKQVIPEVNTLDFENDSIVRLNTSSSKYIVLRKAAIEQKAK